MPAGILADYSVNFASQNTPIVLKESFWSKVKKKIRRYPKNIASKLVYLRSIKSPDLHEVQVAKEVAMGYSCLPKYSCDVVCFMTKYGLLCPNKIRMTRKYSTHQRRLVQSASAIYLAFGLYFISMEVPELVNFCLEHFIH